MSDVIYEIIPARQITEFPLLFCRWPSGAVRPWGERLAPTIDEYITNPAWHGALHCWPYLNQERIVQVDCRHIVAWRVLSS